MMNSLTIYYKGPSIKPQQLQQSIQKSEPESAPVPSMVEAHGRAEEQV